MKLQTRVLSPSLPLCRGHAPPRLIKSSSVLRQNHKDRSTNLRRSWICQAKAAESTAEAEAPSTSNSSENSDEPSLASILQQANSQYEDQGFPDWEGIEQQVQELIDREKLQSSETLETSRTDAQNKYLRLSADFDNFRKRSSAERERQADQIRGDVIKQLIPLVDSFEAAQASIKPETDAEKQTSSAYLGLYKQMVEIFKALGVEAVPGAGQPFDPEYHDAIMREENTDVPNGTVLQELRRGFRLGKTLLRPSMVKVSFSDEPSEAAE